LRFSPKLYQMVNEQKKHLGSECLDVLLVFRAVGKKDFHTVGDPLVAIR